MKMIKKIISTIILFTMTLALVITFSSCKNKNKDVVVDLDTMFAEVTEFMPAETLIDTSLDYMSNVYGLNLEKISKLISYQTINMNSADEIIMIEVTDKDKEYAKEVVKILENIKREKMLSLEGYENNPDYQKEYLKAQESEIYEKGKYIIFIVSDYNNEIKGIVEKHFG